MNRVRIPLFLLYTIRVIQILTFPFFLCFVYYAITSFNIPNYLLVNDLQEAFFFCLLISVVHVGLFVGIALLLSLKDAIHFIVWIFQLIWGIITAPFGLLN